MCVVCVRVFLFHDRHHHRLRCCLRQCDIRFSKGKTLLRTRKFAHRERVYVFIFNHTNGDDDDDQRIHTHDSQNE